MSKSVEINLDGVKEFFNKIIAWLKNFFDTIDQYETIAVAGIGLGLILVIIGLIII